MTSLQNSKSSRRPDISFYQDGRIDITARVVKLLNLQPGDVIDIAEAGGEYLLYVRLQAGQVSGRHFGQVHTTHATKRSRYSLNFRAYNLQLCRALRDKCSGTGYPLHLPCGKPQQKDGHTVLPLITLNPL